METLIVGIIAIGIALLFYSTGRKTRSLERKLDNVEWNVHLLERKLDNIEWNIHSLSGGEWRPVSYSPSFSPSPSPSPSPEIPENEMEDHE